MVNPDNHYRIVRYLKSPIIDLGGGKVPTEKAVRMNAAQLSMVKDGGVKTICADGIREDDAVLPVWKLIADGGCLILANPLSDAGMKLLRKNGKFQVIEREPFVVIRKLSGTGGEVPYNKPSPKPGQKTICMVRYGAFGDHVQMSCVIDHFHNEGWWVVYNCNQKGREVYKGDPRIDEYIDHEDDIVSTQTDIIRAYWDNLSKHFDKFYSFSEIAEKNLLRVEGRQDEFYDPWIKRHAECNKSYFDEHFVRAELPEIKGRGPVIWLSDKEREWAMSEVASARKKTGKSFIVLWNIMGSAFHKMYPWAYDVWWLCEQNRDDIGFLTVSDKLGAFLEESKFKNTFPRSGKYSIRQNLAVHSAVDAIVSTESMSMNVGLAFPVPVVALLSHSSKDQFPFRDFDIPMSASVKDVPCVPCHQLHYSRVSCPRGTYNSDATACMDAIAPKDVYENILRLKYVHDSKRTAIAG